MQRTDLVEAGVFNRMRAAVAALKGMAGLAEYGRAAGAPTISIAPCDLDPDALHRAFQIMHIHGFALVHHPLDTQPSPDRGAAAVASWRARLSAACHEMAGGDDELALRIFNALSATLFDLNRAGGAAPYVAQAISTARCKVNEGSYEGGPRAAQALGIGMAWNLGAGVLGETLWRLGKHGFALIYYAGTSLEAAHGFPGDGRPWHANLSAACNKLAGASGNTAQRLFNAIKRNLFDLDRVALAGTLVAWALSEATCQVAGSYHPMSRQCGTNVEHQSAFL